MEGNFIITGAAEGFGREFSRRVLTRGGRVVMADINQHLGTNTCQHFQQTFGQNCVMFVRTDVTSHDDWERLWSRAKDFLGKIDVLVNNAYAGVSTIFNNTGKKFWEMEPVNTWDTINGVGLRGHYICTTLASRMMVPKHQGLIINVSSSGGLK